MAVLGFLATYLMVPQTIYTLVVFNIDGIFRGVKSCSTQIWVPIAAPFSDAIMFISAGIFSSKAV